MSVTVRTSPWPAAATDNGGGPQACSLVPAECCICGDHDAEPVAVGRDFARPSEPESFLARRCTGCGLIYLDPTISVANDLRIGTQAPNPASATARRWLKRYPPDARVLLIDGSAPDSRRKPAQYDVILLGGQLERAVSPPDLLLEARGMLAPEGRIVVVTHNTDSLQFALFGGRHWSGYEFSRHRNLFGIASLQALARKTGLEIVSVTTASNPEGWRRSLRNLGTDWAFPGYLVRALAVTALAGRAVEAFARLRKRGGFLVAELRHAPGRRSET